MKSIIAIICVLVWAGAAEAALDDHLQLRVEPLGQVDDGSISGEVLNSYRVWVRADDPLYTVDAYNVTITGNLHQWWAIEYIGDPGMGEGLVRPTTTLDYVSQLTAAARATDSHFDCFKSERVLYLDHEEHDDFFFGGEGWGTYMVQDAKIMPGYHQQDLSLAVVVVPAGETATLNGVFYDSALNSMGVTDYTIPEPATLSLLAAGALAMLRRRRRA